MKLKNVLRNKAIWLTIGILIGYFHYVIYCILPISSNITGKSIGNFSHNKIGLNIALNEKKGHQLLYVEPIFDRCDQIASIYTILGKLYFKKSTLFPSQDSLINGHKILDSIDLAISMDNKINEQYFIDSADMNLKNSFGNIDNLNIDIWLSSNHGKSNYSVNGPETLATNDSLSVEIKGNFDLPKICNNVIY